MSPAIINQPQAQHHLSRTRPIDGKEPHTITLVGNPTQGTPSITLVGNPTARGPTNIFMNRSKLFDEGFDEERRPFFVLLKFGVLNINERRVHPEELEGTPIETRSEEAAGT